MWQHTFETLQRGIMYSVHRPEQLGRWADKEEGLMYTCVYLSVVLVVLQGMRM